MHDEATVTDSPSKIRTRDPEERMRAFRRVLSALMRSDAAEQGDMATALAHLTEIAAETMRVERASVWRFSDDRTKLLCEDLYERSPDRHDSGAMIDALDKPRYFEALREERCVAAHDARSDARTSEFAEAYLAPLGIGSMLDAPILFQGDLVGVVCLEHVGAPRTWLAWEELAAGSFADFVAMVLSAAELHRRAAEARDAKAELARRAAAIPRRELKSTGADGTRAFFEFLPAALVVLHMDNGGLRAINRRAKSLLRHFDAGLTAEDIGDIFDGDEDCERVLEKVDAGLNTFRVDVGLRRGDGSRLAARLTAQRMPFDGEPSLVLSLEEAPAEGE